MKPYIRTIYFIICLLCFCFCLWNVKGGWFPSNAVIKKYPNSLFFAFSNDGYIEKIHVLNGDYISNGAVLASMSNSDIDRIEQELLIQNKKHKLLIRALSNSLKNGATDKALEGIKIRKRKISYSIDELKNKLNKLKSNSEIKYEEELRGRVLEIFKTEKIWVNKNEPVLAIRPYEPFYLLKKTLAIFSGLIFLYCLFFMRRYYK